jgi:predicted Zn-dependent protease
MRRAAAVLSVVLLACATNPVTGREEIVLMSPSREASAGKEAAAQVAQEMGLVEDAALLAYVRSVGARVAVHSPRKDVSYQFAIANMAETNAFALPGGYIYVSRGLLALARSEDELANVLAHEVGHVAARHAAQRETRALGVGLLAMLGTVAAGAVGGADAANAVSQLGQVAGAGLIASYGRDQERQADEVGQKMAKAAGYDPDGMATFLDALDQEVKLKLGDKSRRPSFLDSHPATPERVASASARAHTLGTSGGLAPVPVRDAFVARLDGILIDEDPAEGVVREQTFVHPDLDLRVVFPEGWNVQNGRQAVGAQEPEGAALILLGLQERGDDPRAAAEKFVRANAQSLQVVEESALSGAAVPTYRVRARVALSQGTGGAELFWLAHRGAIYRLQCVSGAQAFAGFVPSFERTAKSFRALTSEERAGIRERRLDVARAAGGESLAAFAQRSGNVWKLEQVAIANGVEAGAPLAAGQRIKLAIERPYAAGKKE